MTFREFIGIRNGNEDIETGERMEHRAIFQRAIERFGGLSVVAPYVPYSLEDLRECAKNDPYLSNTALGRWTVMAGFSLFECKFTGGGVWNLYRMHGINSASCAEGVCLLKEAALMLVEQAEQKEHNARTTSWDRNNEHTYAQRGHQDCRRDERMSTNAEQKRSQLPLEQFRDWLDHGTEPLALSGRSWDHILIRLPRAEDIDYVFDQRSYWGKERGKINFRDSFEFACLYDRTHKQLYGSPQFGEAVSDIESMGVQSFEALKAEAQAAVNQLVEQRIGNDRNNLSVKSIINADTKRWLEQQEYGAQEEARRCFFDGGDMSDMRFTSDYRTGEWSEGAILSYIRDPAAYVQREADLYICNNQEDFLAQFLENDALLAEWQALLDNQDDPIHRMKSIKDAVQSCGGKTVSVTVQKEGKELTFHTEASPLTRLDSYYSTYSIQAQDRRSFEELFGRYSHYTATDVTKITYGRQTIYEAPAPEQAQAEEPAQGMAMGGMV